MKIEDSLRLLSSAISYVFFTTLSRMSGFFRDMVIARYMGAGISTDIFFVAFKIPNSFRRMLAEGALSPAFVPIFSQLIDKNAIEARKFAGDIVIFITVITTAIVCLINLYASQVISAIAPGFNKSPEILATASIMLQLNMPFLISISITAILGGSLNSVHVFSYFAAIPILLNSTMIVFMLFFGQQFQTYGWCLSYAVVFVTLVQPLIMLFGCYKNNIVPVFRIIKPTYYFKKFTKALFPVIMGQGVFQINVFVDSIFASFFTAGISYLYYTDRIGQFATTIIGHTLGIVSLPLLSRRIKSNLMDEAMDLKIGCIKWAIIFAVPASSFLMTFSTEITALIYQYGHFTSSDTFIVSNMVAIYAISISFISINRILNACMFALGDTRTPMIIGIASVIINIAINMILIDKIQYYSVIIATCCSAAVEFIASSFCLKYKHRFWKKSKDNFKTFIKSCLSCCVLVILASKTISFVGISSNLSSILIAGSFGIGYFVIMHLLGALNMRIMFRSIFNRS